MQTLAAVAAMLVVAWAVLLVVAQVHNPEQSPLSMGMSGLTRGRAPWVMKSSLIVRGLSALVLVAALPADLRAGLAAAGVVLLWVWGLGSAALALADTDMPGEAPTPTGRAHALIAMVAYIAGVAGALVLSYAMLHNDVLSMAAWALPIAVTAAAALAVQFVAFWAAAREAQAATPAARSVAQAPAEPEVAVAEPASPTVAPRLVAGVPPQLGADTGASTAAPQRIRAAAAQRTAPAATTGTGLLHDLASYAGLYQRIFVGLLMAWTLLVALGVLSF